MDKGTLSWEKDGKVSWMTVGSPMPPALTSREWAGFIAIKTHLKLPMEGAMEACGSAFFHSYALQGWLSGWQDCRQEKMLQERNSAQ